MNNQSNQMLPSLPDLPDEFFDSVQQQRPEPEEFPEDQSVKIIMNTEALEDEAYISGSQRNIKNSEKINSELKPDTNVYGKSNSVTTDFLQKELAGEQQNQPQVRPSGLEPPLPPAAGGEKEI